MSKREKVILILMGIALLYGAYSYLGPSSNSSDAISQKVLNKDLDTYILSIAAAMPQFALNDQEKYIIASAVTEWAGDPFLKEAVTENNQAEKAAVEIQQDILIQYTGFLEMGGKRLAIINGQEYGAGEQLAVTGYRVARIFPSRVEIKIEGREGTLVIPLEEASAPAAGKK